MCDDGDLMIMEFDRKDRWMGSSNRVRDGSTSKNELNEGSISSVKCSTNLLLLLW